jgi:hypothetical protein
MNNTDKRGAKWYMVTLGIILMPILFCTFIIDRFLMVFLVMGDAPDIVEYFQDIKYIGISILRVIVATLVTLIAMWIW